MKATLAAVFAGWIAFYGASVEAQCLDEVCVRTSTDVTTVSTQQNVMLDGLLSGALGTSVDLTVLDQQALADATVDLSSLTRALNANGVGNDAATALGTTTLDTLLRSLSTATRGDASNATQVAAATAIDKLRTQSASVGSGTVALGDLLSADLGAQALLESDLNVLDTVTGSVSTFNKRNVVAVQPVTVQGSTLGLGSLVNSVQLAAVVVEPAKYVCGKTGAQFYSASVRLRLRISLTNGTTVLPVAGLANVALTLAPSLDLVAAVGRASGTIQTVDAMAKTASLTAAPGLAELYLGTISDQNFLDRTTPINPATELAPATVASLSIGITLPLTPAITATANVTARGYALGTPPAAEMLSFAGPFPQTKRSPASAGSLSATSLLSSLLSNLEVSIGAANYAPPALAAVGAGVLDPVLTLLTTTVSNTLKGTSNTLGMTLSGLMTGLVDPLLGQLGVKIGAVDVTVEEPFRATDTGCVINGQCISSGTPDPGNSCKACNPAVSLSAYSNKPSGSSCSDGAFCTVSDQCNGSGTCAGTTNACSDGLACSVDTCDEALDRCVNTIGLNVGCVINGACVAAGTDDPSNSCRSCNPLLSMTSYSNKAAGLPCADGLFCTANDSCDGAGACTSTARDCGDGIACTLDTCDEANDRCASTVSGGCNILGTCVASGATDPLNSCRVCNPAVSTTNYTNKVAGSGCDDGLFCTTGETCNVLGLCLGAPRSCGGGGCLSVCDELEDRCRTDVTGCAINGACVALGTEEPGNPCHVCLPAVSSTSWTNKPGGTPCDDGLFCTTGDACDAAGSCTGGARGCGDALGCTNDSCDEAQDLCVQALVGGCVIDSLCVAAGVADAVNPCRYCDPTRATTTWSNKAAGITCDDGLYCTTGDACNGEGVCTSAPRSCGGTGCSSACDETTDACRSDVASCSIDGACIAAGTAAAGRPCLVCDPTRSTTSWSTRAAGTACDDGQYCTTGDTCNGNGACGGATRSCGGIGCSSTCDEDTDSCRQNVAGCDIAGVCLAPGSTLLGNPCMVCDPSRSTTAWTFKSAGTSCEDGQFCTTGETCNALGLCLGGAPRTCNDGAACTTDICDETADRCVSSIMAGCVVDGACVAAGVDDPTNPCRSCNPAVSAFGFTSKSSGVSCTDGLFCTNGDTCNGLGACAGTLGGCGAATGGGTCASFCDEANDACRTGGAGCAIANTCVSGGTDNPDNPCQTCDPLRSATGWSPKSVGQPCNDGQFCTVNEVCGADGVCAGATNGCSDGLACTNDACNEQSDSCVHATSDACVIDNTCVERGASEPGNSCHVCDPTRSARAWSNAPAELPCDDGRFCTAEDRCDANGVCGGRRARCADSEAECTRSICNEEANACQFELSTGCLIDGACVAEGASSPGNACMVCAREVSTDSFVYQADAASCDSDGDGLRDSYERREDGGEVDSDGDGIPNHLDLDDDNDGIPTREEAPDPNNDGSPGDARDSDLDGNADYVDPDDDEDNRLTRRELEDAETWGEDVDADGTPNWYDVDSDADGASDLAENLGDGDSNNNDIPDYVEAGVTPRDGDRDGLSDLQECVAGIETCGDSDGDGLIDAEDPDDDNDGLLTRYELRLQRPHDTDRDGDPNHLDADDDNDTVVTRDESADPNADGNPSDARDSDRDGLADYLDLDDDGDGIPTATEIDEGRRYGGDDLDGDGIPNWLDEDADGDGQGDGNEGRDTDGDGTPDYLDDPAAAADAGRWRAGGVAGGAGCSAASSAADGFGGALWLLIAALGGRAWRRRPTRLATAAIALTLWAGASPRASAQVTLDSYAPTPSTTDGFAVARADTTGHLRVDAQLQLDFARNPLVWENVLGDGSTAEIKLVHNQLVGHAVASLTVYERALVYVALPVNFVMKGESGPPGIAADGAGLGNLRLGARVRLVGAPHDLFALAITAELGLPSAKWGDDDEQLAGEHDPTGHVFLTGELRPGRAHLALNVGARFRDATLLSTLEVEQELTYGLGAGYDVLQGATRLELLLELHGATSLSDFADREQSPLELLGGAKLFRKEGVMLGLGVGPGLTAGYGSPDFRVIGMVGYSSQSSGDADVDGVPDRRDHCPEVAEDRDGFQDGDGCPDVDNDRDGIPDASDKCPDQAEDKDGIADDDGCPDGDNDGDGIPDATDKCQNEPEDKDTFEDDDGCPDLDNDGDGVVDAEDKCLGEEEDADGFADADGCPDPDNDGDGILDAKDQCPLEAETLNQRDDEDGCPDLIRVNRDQGQILILEPVRFALGSYTILDASFDMLREVAALLKVHPEITRVRVEGHTDDKGNDAKNLKLSQNRANAVRTFVVDAGVAPDRVVAQGLGETKPTADNTSEAGREANRRVEFHIESIDLSKLETPQ
ncbi:MAG: OmpA family protein [Polyangiales bacterium]